MFSKVWLVNLCLAGLALFLGLKTYDLWTTEEKPPVPEMQSPQKEGRYPRVAKSSVVNRGRVRESAYKGVAQKNLFSPDRAEFIPEEPEKPEPEVKKLSLLGRKITLYGVMIMGDYKSALISNPFREADERKNKWVKPGDTVGELEVIGIEKARILLAEKGEKYEIPLYDEGRARKKARVKSEKPKRAESAKPTVIVSETQKETAESKKGNVESEFEEFMTPFGKMRRKKSGARKVPNAGILQSGFGGKSQ